MINSSTCYEENVFENGKTVADIILEHYPNLRKLQEFALNHKDKNIVLIAPTKGIFYRIEYFMENQIKRF